MLSFPKVLRIEPSSQCNLACSHCPTGTIDMPREVMNELTFINVINNIILFVMLGWKNKHYYINDNH
jgi:MoaA/NifB/PqqE/SkfB family radical SAM enzyme